MLVALLTAPLVVGLASAMAPSASAQPELSGKTVECNVLTSDTASQESAEAAVLAAGGTVVKSNRDVGLITAKAPENGFTARLAQSRAVQVAAPATVIGRVPVAPKAKLTPRSTVV